MKELKEGELGKIMRKAKSRSSIFDKRLEEDKDTNLIVIYPDGTVRKLRADELPEPVEEDEDELDEDDFEEE